MMMWIGVLIVIATIYCIMKNYESRLVLLVSGFAMACVALAPMSAFDAFATNMVSESYIKPILSVMGFTFVLKATECDKHLVHMLAGAITKFRVALIPLAVAVTFVISIALPSAAGVGAAVGAIVIPVMMAAGISPAVAAAAVLAGTFGPVMSPGGANIVMVADMSGLSEIETVGVVAPTAIVCLVIVAASLAIVAHLKKEDRGYVADNLKEAETIKVQPLKAIVPFVPLVLLILGALPAFESWNMTVPTAMIIGTILAGLVGRTSAVTVTKEFFNGMGKAYANVMGIIIAAGVFTAGLTSVGIVDALINSLTGAKGAVGASATWGPMLVAALSGSGNAAIIAFNKAVTPHAAEFGLTIEHLGTLATLAGNIGRCISPVAGVTIIVAGIAGANPMDVVKRNFPGILLASIAAFIMMGI